MASDTRAVERAIPALLHQRYGIEAKAIAPAAGGEIGMAFVATADGARWFVKASLPQSWYSRPLESLKGALNASAAIKPQVMSAEVVAPLRSIDGDRVVLSDGWRISVFPFVDAQPIGRRQDWPDEVLIALSRAVGELQEGTASVRRDDLQGDDFFLWYNRPLTEALPELSALESSNADEGQLRARHHVLGREADLLDMVEGYDRLRSKVREKTHELVVSHTDLHANNVLRDIRGGLYIVDWDDCALCAPERDIRYLIDPRRLNLVRRAYAEARGAFEVDAETLAFYRQRDALADLTLFVWRTLEPSRTPAEHERDAGIIETFDWMYRGGLERDTEQVLALFK